MVELFKGVFMVRRDVFFIFVIGVVLFTVGLPCEFIGFQTRFAVLAKEMVVNGPSLFPTVYNVPYADYSSAATLPIYYLSKVFGEVSPFTAILPTAIVSALVLVFTYLIGATYSRKWGLLGVLFCVMTLIFVGESRGVSMDMYVTLAVVVCFYIVHSAKLTGRKVRLGFIPLVMVAGYAFRGTHGLVLPALVVGCYFLWEREY
ncbi:MAG: glycosyltransferase, partial [Planctomycetes bacterium]|nr:glycosyltransferase [Planctomycetota bacterium]